jgi:hypothetical protein
LADLRITELPALAGANLASGDLLPIADISASETKKITVVDLVGNATTLIADATIPSAKVLFGSGSIVAASLATDSVTTAKIAADAVTAAKLADESTVDLVTTLPGSGAFVGQIALDTDDNNAYIWNGSAWISFKAAGSVNSAVGSTSGIINIVVSTSGSEVTISATLDNTSSAAQFLAGPTANSGAVSYRTIAGGDLPTATTSSKGGVSVNGSGLRLSGTEIQIDNDITASAVTYGVVTYNEKGLVTAGRTLISSDVPTATGSAKGAVIPGTGLTVTGGGTLNHSNTATPGTYTKVTVDAQGHVSAGSSLLAADLPAHSATLLTSGTLDLAVIGNNAITGAKLADYSTIKFGGAGSTSNVVTFPTPDFTGQGFFDSTNGDYYIYDGNTWQPLTVISGDLVYAGTYNASTNRVASTTTAGSAAGLTVGAVLPAASETNNRYYVVVSQSGTGVSPAPIVALAPPDMILSNGATWDLIDVSNAIAGQTATNISFTPYGNLAATNVQTALQELDDEKLSITGGTITGDLVIGPAGSFAFEGSNVNAYETFLTAVDPTADRTITFNDVSGTVVTTGDTGIVTSGMILDGTIVNGDISATAAIADTKLGTISTAGKVSNSATTAASANTASAIVARDGSGNFSAGTITAALTGNATTATTLATARNIQGVSFDGSAAITVVTAGTGISVTGTAVANTGVLSVNGSTGIVTGLLTSATAATTYAPLASPTFTGTVTIPAGASISGFAALASAQSFTAQQRGTISALTDGATITPDFAVANNFSVTLGGNRTLANPSNLTAGASGCIWITQDGTGSRTLAYGSQWDFTGGTAPTLTTTAAAVDCLVYSVQSSTKITATLITNLS